MKYQAQLVHQHEILWNLLNSIPAIVSAAPGGIYGPPGTPDDWTPENGRTLVFLGGSFTENSDMPTTQNQYRILCYGQDGIDAANLYRIVYANLHRRGSEVVPITGGNALFIYAKQTSGPNDNTDSSSGWNWCWGMWEIHLAENYI